MSRRLYFDNEGGVEVDPTYFTSDADYAKLPVLADEDDALMDAYLAAEAAMRLARRMLYDRAQRDVPLTDAERAALAEVRARWVTVVGCEDE